jgi:hypothetical protein
VPGPVPGAGRPGSARFTGDGPRGDGPRRNFFQLAAWAEPGTAIAAGIRREAANADRLESWKPWGNVPAKEEEGMISTKLKVLTVGALIVAATGCSVMRGQQTTGAYLDDTNITANIKSAYAADQTVAATAISVETLNGTVQLSGFAKSQAEKDRAAAIARQTKGVVAVKNDIVVRP